MNFRSILAILGVLVFGSGVVLAISGASIVGSEVERGRWSGITAEFVTTEGGNISGVDINGTTLTDRWASYYGNVSGDIILTDSVGTSRVYTWTWTPADGGEVCVSDASAFNWTAVVAGLGSSIDTAMGWGSGADTGTITYTGAGGSITFNGVAPITTADSVTLTGSSTFDDVVVTDTTELAYCTDIDDAGTNYAGEDADYEIMVPTPDDVGDTVDYYFFAELN